MPSVQFRKIQRDLWLYKGRAALLILAIAVGVAAVGMLVSGARTLRANLDAGYAATHPAHAIFTLSDFDESTLAQARLHPAVLAAEARRTISARLEIGSLVYAVRLVGLPEGEPQVSRIVPEGAEFLPPAPGEIVLERTVPRLFPLATGDRLTFNLLDDTSHPLQVAGFVNDQSDLPADISLQVAGFVSMDTLESLGAGGQGYNTLLVRFTPSVQGRPAIEAAAGALAIELEEQGLTVFALAVPEPDQQILEDNMQSVLLILGAFGPLTLLLGGFLVINVMAAAMAQQIPQIGALKSLGARVGSILRLYLSMVLVYGLLALTLAVPGGLAGAYFLSQGLAEGMNFDIQQFTLAPQALALQVLGALLLPLLAAFWPVWQGARLSVRAAISGQGDGHYRRGLLAWLLARLPRLRQMARLSINNVFRRPARLTLTLTALTLAGAMFMATLGIQSALQRGLAENLLADRYDVSLDLAGLTDRATLLELALAQPGVAQAEGWLVLQARPQLSEDVTGSTLLLFGVPQDSEMTRPRVVAGHWPAAGAAPPQLYLESVSAERLGQMNDNLTLTVGGQSLEFSLVGRGPRSLQPLGYMLYEDLAVALSLDGFANRLVVSTLAHDAASQNAAQAALLTALKDAGHTVVGSSTTAAIQAASAANLDRITGLLLAMVVLTAVVGGLGLAITMSLSVLERTREIGILRSLGARGGQVRQMVLLESLLTAWLSVALAAALAQPLGARLGNILGQALLAVDLDFQFPWTALGIWLALLTVIAVVASVAPARAAARLTIRAALAYEG